MRNHFRKGSEEHFDPNLFAATMQQKIIVCSIVAALCELII